MEIPGSVYGVASLMFLKFDTDDHGLPAATNADRLKQLNLSLLNHGVQAGNRFILTAAHTETDIAQTITAYESAFTELRAEGLI